MEANLENNLGRELISVTGPWGDGECHTRPQSMLLEKKKKKSSKGFWLFEELFYEQFNLK